MKVFKVFWGWLVGDVRFVSMLLVSLVLAVLAILVVHQLLLGAFFIWLGLIGSLWVSIEQELKAKTEK